MNAKDILAELYGQTGDVKTLQAESLFFISAVFNQWGGRQSEDVENIGSSDVDKVTSLQMKVAPLPLLRPFGRLRNRVYAKLDKAAARFYAFGDNTWVGTEDMLPKIKDVLQDAKADFDVVLQEFRLNYDRDVEEFFKDKQFESQLRQSKKDVEDVIEKFKFSHTIFQVSGASCGSISDETVFDSFLVSLSKQAAAIQQRWERIEAQKSANPSAKASASKRTGTVIPQTKKLEERSIAPLFELLEKARSFAFVSEHAEAIANYLEQKLAPYKSAGTITDPAMIIEARNIVNTMSDYHSLRRFGDVVLEQEAFRGSADLDLPPEWLEMMGVASADSGQPAPSASESFPTASVSAPAPAPSGPVAPLAAQNAPALQQASLLAVQPQTTGAQFFVRNDEALFNLSDLPELDELEEVEQ